MRDKQGMTGAWILSRDTEEGPRMPAPGTAPRGQLFSRDGLGTRHSGASTETQPRKPGLAVQ